MINKKIVSILIFVIVLVIMITPLKDNLNDTPLPQFIKNYSMQIYTLFLSVIFFLLLIRRERKYKVYVIGTISVLCIGLTFLSNSLESLLQILNLGFLAGIIIVGVLPNKKHENTKEKRRK